MKFSSFFVCLPAMLVSSISWSQSVYHFQYNYHQPADSTTYNAFFIRYNDGSGLLRVRYVLPATAQDILVEMDVEETFNIDTVTGKTDTSTLFLQALNPRVIIGNNNTSLKPPYFQFRYNQVSGFYEPSGVTNVASTHLMSTTTSFAATLIDRAGLNKAFVSAFFSEDEDFYVNLFKGRTKGLSQVEKNTRLFLLVVADTMDTEIGHSCGMDMKRATETFRGIADSLGIKYLPQAIAGASYSKKNVEAAVNNLKPSANDIIVFYYSGHGFRKENDSRRFPNIKLKTHHTSRQDVLDNSLNMEDIFNSIIKKPARFNLVLSDCCNSDIETTNATGTKPGRTKGSGLEWSEDNCRSLFLSPARLSVLATSADNGQKAASNNDFGGFFTYFFKTSMENYCSKLKSVVNWDLVLQDAKTQTIFKAKHTYCDKPYIPENICNQYPNYKIVSGR